MNSMDLKETVGKPSGPSSWTARATLSAQSGREPRNDACFEGNVKPDKADLTSSKFIDGLCHLFRRESYRETDPEK